MRRATRNQVSKSTVPTQGQNENLPPQNKLKKSKGSYILQAAAHEKNTLKVTEKRKAEEETVGSLKMMTKRSAFGDITNAIEKSLYINSKQDPLKKTSAKPIQKNVLTCKQNDNKQISKPNEVKVAPQKENKDSLDDSVIILSEEFKYKKISLESSNMYITASEGSPMSTPVGVLEDNKALAKRQDPPDGVEDFDAASTDLNSVSDYAFTIFKYYKEREKFFNVNKYLAHQPEITKKMRAILVDWMVEVQESFELNHETLYLAVKVVDLYLSKKPIKRDQLQLVGSTAIFIACKFDEHTPPYVDDFLFICDDAYKRRELILLEINILKTLDFNLGIPLSYRFLRRYSRCGRHSMETLTFARYILELSLMEYEFVGVRDSVLATAALFLALRIKEDFKEFPPALQYYSGYELDDVYHYIHLLHQMLLQPPKEYLKNVRRKYSHRIFFTVAEIPVPESLRI